MTETIDQMTHPHDSFQPTVNVQVIRDQDVKERSMGFILALSLKCLGCDVDFWWPGIKTGQSFSHPGVTPDGFTVTLPTRPANMLRMDADSIPDIEFTQDGKEDRKTLIKRAVAHPDAFTLQLVNEDRNDWRARAIIKALEG